MSKGEFDIISRYFQRKADSASDVLIGIGDDCAILDIANGYQLAVTTDSLVCGVHFFADVDPYRLGYKSLAVNLSDLAAMGATARWVSLAITLPSIDEPWLAEFCRGFFALADKFNVQLIGGDTTKGPLSITVSAKGVIKSGQALTRKQAQADDIICVSGCLGDGALGLAVKLQQYQQSENPQSLLSLRKPQAFIDALELTEPRLEMGALLLGSASSCIDISDGLNQDLSHILKQSQCSAEIRLQDLPLSNAMREEIKLGTITLSQAWQFAVNGGDDYELLFTISPHKLAVLKEQLALHNDKSSLLCFEIGKVNAITTTDVVDHSSSHISTHLSIGKEPAIIFTDHDQIVTLDNSSWDHFK